MSEKDQSSIPSGPPPQYTMPDKYEMGSAPPPYPPAYPQQPASGQYYPPAPPVQAGPPNAMGYSQPAVMVLPTTYGTGPQACQCPNCQARIVTAVEYKTGTATWVACIVLCVFGCFYGCCLIPFCVDGLKDAEHSCPNCHSILGQGKRM